MNPSPVLYTVTELEAAWREGWQACHSFTIRGTYVPSYDQWLFAKANPYRTTIEAHQATLASVTHTGGNTP